MADDPTPTEPSGDDAAIGSNDAPDATVPRDAMVTGTKPWTRRRFLGAVAAVGGTAAMGAVVWAALNDEDDEDGGGERRAEPKLNAASPQTETRTLQFTLGHAAGVEGITLHVAGVRYPLVPHTDETRAAFVATDPLLARSRCRGPHPLRRVRLAAAGRAADARAPAPARPEVHRCEDRVPRVDHPRAHRGHGRRLAAPVEPAGGRPGIEVDPQYRQLVSDATVRKVDAGQLRKATQALAAVGAGGLVGGNAARWARLGFNEGNAPKTPEQAQVMLQVTDDAMSSAISLVIKHPDIATYDVDRCRNDRGPDAPRDRGADPRRDHRRDVQPRRGRIARDVRPDGRHRRQAGHLAPGHPGRGRRAPPGAGADPADCAVAAPRGRCGSEHRGHDRQEPPGSRGPLLAAADLPGAGHGRPGRRPGGGRHRPAGRHVHDLRQPRPQGRGRRSAAAGRQRPRGALQRLPAPRHGGRRLLRPRWPRHRHQRSQLRRTVPVPAPRQGPVRPTPVHHAERPDHRRRHPPGRKLAGAGPGVPDRCGGGPAVPAVAGPGSHRRPTPSGTCSMPRVGRRTDRRSPSRSSGTRAC